MQTQNLSSSIRLKRDAAFTIVETMIALAIFGAFALGSTATLNLMDTRAARNRNAEAARSLLDDYVNFLLADSTSTPAATAVGTDIDGDGVPDGVAFTSLDSRTLTNGVLPLVVTRSATPVSVVNGTLYWQVQAVGTSYGLAKDTDLMQVNFTLAYVFRGQTFYYKAMTFKS